MQEPPANQIAHAEDGSMPAVCRRAYPARTSDRPATKTRPMESSFSFSAGRGPSAPGAGSSNRSKMFSLYTCHNRQNVLSELLNQAAHADNKSNVSYTVFLKVKEGLPGVSHAMQSTTRQYYYCVHYYYAEHKRTFWRRSAHLIVRHSHCQRLHASVHFLHADDAIIGAVSLLRSWKSHEGTQAVSTRPHLKDHTQGAWQHAGMGLGSLHRHNTNSYGIF
jgi:hypothetical protein